MPKLRSEITIKWDVEAPETTNHVEGALAGFQLRDWYADHITDEATVWIRPIIAWMDHYTGTLHQTYRDPIKIPRDLRVLRDIAKFLLESANDVEADQLAKGTLDDPQV